MINKLTITNIQSHAETELEFHEGVNIIIGPTDSGKSAILRSIRWITTGKPSGNSIRSWWDGQALVGIFTKEGSVFRSKDKQDQYRLCINGEKEHIFKAFGTDVPEEINRYLNINEINLQRQLDAPFLLSETPGAVAQHFNKIAKLDKIDSATSNINAWIRQLTSDIKYKEEQELTLTENLGDFDYLEKFEAEVEVLEGMEERLRKTKKQREKFFDLIVECQEVCTAIDFESDYLQFEKPLNLILLWIEEKDIRIADRKELKSVLKAIAITQVDINYNNNIVSLENLINSTLQLYKEVKELKYDKVLLNKVILSVSNINTQIGIVKEKYDKLQEKLNSIKVCPFCGTKLK
jgi:exonuclease SbcC